MFKVFLSFLIFLAGTGRVYAQTDFSSIKEEQEKTLNEYINASAVCAKMTDAEALYERGMLLLNDANNEAYLAAADCFTSAAMKNHTKSQLELGKLYEKGNGVSQSVVYAYKWYQTAVLLGNQDAVSFRNKLESRMTLDEISLANPMIQTTLDLIEAIDRRKQEEIEKLEKQVEQEYQKFGVNISQYDFQDDTKSNYDNPLIDTLIREQKKKEEKRRMDERNNQNETMSEEAENPENSENVLPRNQTGRKRKQRQKTRRSRF